MRIGIISDIHDHLHNLRPAIGYLCDNDRPPGLLRRPVLSIRDG